MENMVTYKAANMKIRKAVNDKDEEIKRRTNLAIKRVKKAEKALKDSQAEAERWKEKVEDSEKGEVEDLRVKLVEAAKKVEEKEEENKRAEEISVRLQVTEEEKRGLKGEVDRLTADLATQALVQNEKKRDSVMSTDMGVNTDEIVELMVVVRPEPMEGVIGLADSEVLVVPTVSRHQWQSSLSTERRPRSVSNSGGGLRSHGNRGERAGVMAKAVVVYGININ